MLSNAILQARLVGTGDVIDTKKVESIVVVLVEYTLLVCDIDSIVIKISCCLSRRAINIKCNH